MSRNTLPCLAAASLFLALAAAAQQTSMPGMDMSTHAAKKQSPSKQSAKDSNMNMPGMNMSGSSSMSMSQPATLIQSILAHTTSGTSIEPASTPMPMLMTHRGAWTLMLHGLGSVADIQQQSRPTATSFPLATCLPNDAPCSPIDRRGGDKLYSVNWIMPMAMRQLGSHGQYGQLTLRTMLSLEPATVSARQFPELFQQGETAFGKPIVDGQHPHDFFMELGALYDLHLGEHALLSLYAAPIGDPAVGPTAYPHRLSASEDPLAALGHHQQDSTHIAFNVLTAGVTYRTLRLEASGFHGAEPDEQHWGFQPSPNGLAIDSYSTRLTFSPRPNWTAQYSLAHITSPESLYPGEDQARQTASLMYNRPFGPTDTSGSPSGNWSNTLLWGRTRSLADNAKENSYLLESLLQFHTRNFLWTRIENAGRSNELLLSPNTPLPPNFHESPLGHVAEYSLGFDRDLFTAHHLRIAPGAQFTSYTTPTPLIPAYGTRPYGVVAFLRFRLSN